MNHLIKLLGPRFHLILLKLHLACHAYKIGSCWIFAIVVIVHSVFLLVLCFFVDRTLRWREQRQVLLPLQLVCRQVLLTCYGCLVIPLLLPMLAVVLYASLVLRFLLAILSTYSHCSHDIAMPPHPITCCLFTCWPLRVVVHVQLVFRVCFRFTCLVW